MLAVLPAAGPLLLIHRYGVDFHRYDEWDPGIAGLFVKFHNHQATLADLFVQNNEHRIVVPRLLLLLTNPLTHWNNFAVLLMGWACACVTSLVVLALIRKSLATHARILPIWFCCNLLIFSPLQFEIWLWGIGLDQWMLTAILFLSFLIAISRLPLPSKLALCIVLAAASTYCFGNGLLAWPLTGILLLWSVRADLDRPKKSAAVFAWIAACLLCVGFYFHHYIAPPSSAKYSGGIGILDRLLYNLVFMGSPFAHAIHYSATVACAVLGAVMFAMLLSLAAYFARAWTTGRKQLCDRMIVWFIVAAYALLSGLMASFSRAEYGAEQAITSRYIAFAVYLPLALVVLIPIVAADWVAGASFPRHAVANVTLCGLVLALVVLEGLAVPKVLDACWTTRLTQRQGKAALLLVDELPNNPLIPYLVGIPQNVIPEAHVLNEMGYLHPPLTQTDDASQLEARDDGENAPVVGQLDGCAADPRGFIDVSGWAINRDTMQFADGVVLTYQDSSGRPIIFAPARTNALRKDILQRYGKPIYEWSGWQARFVPAEIPPQIKNTTINAWVLDADTGLTYRLKGGCAFRR